MRRAFYAAMIISFARKLLGKTLVPTGSIRVKSRKGDRPCECAMFMYDGTSVNYRIGMPFIVGERASVDVDYMLNGRFGKQSREFGYYIGFYTTHEDDVIRGYPPEFTSKPMMDFLDQAYVYVTKIVPEGTRMVWS